MIYLLCCIALETVLYVLAWGVWSLGLWKLARNIRKREQGGSK